MEKPVILKEAPKSKVYKKNDKLNTTASEQSKKIRAKLSQTNSNKESYLNFYDDIKIPSKKYDW